MSEASRAAALQHAAAVHQGSGDPVAILETAEAFHAFITSGSNGADITVAPKAAKAAAATPKQPAKPKPQPKTEPEEEDEAAVTKEEVGASIEALLNANLRAKAVALIGKYGAKSLSGVDPSNYAALKAAAYDLLMSV